MMRDMHHLPCIRSTLPEAIDIQGPLLPQGATFTRAWDSLPMRVNFFADQIPGIATTRSTIEGDYCGYYVLESDMTNLVLYPV